MPSGRSSSGRTHDPWALLARLLVPSAELLRLQATMAAAMGGAPEVPDQVRPGRWDPDAGHTWPLGGLPTMGT